MILKSFSDSLTSSCCQIERPQRHRHAKIHALPKTLSYDGRFPKEDAHCGCLNLEKTEAVRILRSGFLKRKLTDDHR